MDMGRIRPFHLLWVGLVGLSPQLFGSMTVYAQEPRATVDLRGTWQIRALGSSDPYQTITVPRPFNHDWLGEEAFLPPRLNAEYRRTFNLPAEWEGKRILLSFGAVNRFVRILINGQAISMERPPVLGSFVFSAWVPLIVEITNWVDVPSQNNVLSVETRWYPPVNGASQDPLAGLSGPPNISPEGWPGAFPWADGGPRSWEPLRNGSPAGILWSAELQAIPEVYLRDVFIKPSVRNQRIDAEVSVVNPTMEPFTGTLTFVILRDRQVVKMLPSRTITVPGGGVQIVTVGDSWPEAQRWWPNVPYDPTYRATLDTLQVQLNADKAEEDELTTRFGFRESWTERGRYYLNGVPINLRGDNLHPFFDLEKDGLEEVRPRIRRALQMNLNTWRLHSFPADPAILDLCDEEGLLVLDETAFFYGQSWPGNWPMAPSDGELALIHLRELIRRDRNHPSLFAYSLENEERMSGGFNMGHLRQLLNVAQPTDPTRPLFIDDNPRDEDHLGSLPSVGWMLHYWGISAGIPRDAGAERIRLQPYQTPLRLADLPVPLGVGEDLWYPRFSDRGRPRPEHAVLTAIWSRGYRYINAADIRIHTVSYASGYLRENWVDDEPGQSGGGSNGPLTTLVRNTFHPLGVYDVDFERNNLPPNALNSNPQGFWPLIPQGGGRIPQYDAGEPIRRTVVVYNDEFRDSPVTVTWEGHLNTPSGPIPPLARGLFDLSIPLGGHREAPIVLPAPDVLSPTTFYLVLKSAKGEQPRFEEGTVFFRIVPPQWDPGPRPAAATDLSASPLSSTIIQLDWQDNATNELGYLIQRATLSASGPWFTIQGDLPQNTTTYQDTELRPNQRYGYRVFAWNRAGPSEPSNVADTRMPRPCIRGDANCDGRINMQDVQLCVNAAQSPSPPRALIERCDLVAPLGRLTEDDIHALAAQIVQQP